jgi:clan AA aspartic protease (TIGR02281 family)
MHRSLKAAFATFIFFVGSIGSIDAGPLDDGKAAFDRGDYATALRLWRPLGDQGDAVAQNNLGNLYRREQDDSTAVSWYRKAADQGYAIAQSNLWFMYRTGHGVPQDDAAAMSWIRKAADQGYAIAQNNLGNLYRVGEGVPQDNATAVFWLRKAADQGNAIAQSNLGFMYFNGLGVPQDYVSGMVWSALAAAGGNKEAARNRDVFTAKMTPAQIAESQKRAMEWRPRVANAGPKQTQIGVPLKMDGGIFVVPVEINGAMTLDFVIDSGAADVSVPADVFSTLKRAGTISELDVIGRQTYVLADGSKSQSATFTIKSLRVGGMVVKNVRGSVASSRGSLLLGQSFLEHFKSWSIDNTKHQLFLEPL